MASNFEEYFKKTFDTNIPAQKELNDKLSLLDNSNQCTQIDSAKQMLKENAYLNHMKNVITQTLVNNEIEGEEKDRLLNYANAQITEYEKKYGKLNQEVLKQLKFQSAVVPVSSQKQTKNILNKLEKANSQVLSKIK